jgi:uncharacterized membrane protein (UPF0127 family)
MFLNKLQFIIIIILIPIGLLYLYSENKGVSMWDLFLPGASVIRIDEVPIRVEIANSHEERVNGLSGRESLEDVSGLFFVFPEPGYHSIWMKDMRFPIDIIWISEDLLVVGIDANVSPDTYPDLFRPPEPAKYVLETNARYANIFGLRVGHAVTLPPDFLEN